MRIGFITQWFPPEQGTFVASAIADGLASRGHHVDVVTGFPNYPTGKAPSRLPAAVLSPGSAISPSHGPQSAAVSQPQHQRGISIRQLCQLRRVSNLRSPVQGSASGRLAGVLFPSNCGHPGAVAHASLPCSHVPHGSGPVARKRDRERRFSLASQVARPNEALDYYCRWTYRRSAGIGIISPGMQEILLARGVDADKIHLTPNWVDDGHLLPNSTPSADLRSSLGLPKAGCSCMPATSANFKASDRW